MIADPEYNQEPAYALNNLIGGHASNNILRAAGKTDITRVPSHVWVRGKDSKPGEKVKLLGHYDNSANTAIFKPFFYKDAESNDQEHCCAVAAYMVGKAMRDFLTYECTVRGFTNQATGRIYNIDTVVNLQDEVIGMRGPMWVMSRTFNKSRTGGTTTTLKLLPALAFIMDYLIGDVPAPPPPSYPAARAKMPNPRPATFERGVAGTWSGTEGEAFGVSRSNLSNLGKGKKK